jgi:hypothetical protein
MRLQNVKPLYSTWISNKYLFEYKRGSTYTHIKLASSKWPLIQVTSMTSTTILLHAYIGQL